MIRSVTILVLLMLTPTFSLACEATLAHYRQLELGMSVEQAVSIVGCEGKELASSNSEGYSMHMLQWRGGSDLASMDLTFENDQLTSKSQFGLE